jgi:phenylacetate-CoA ligase
MRAAAVGSPIELTIIVPCYNEAENVIELAERARAMFDARGLAGEVVFVNDASTDHTGALIDELARKYEFVRGVHHATNKGMSGGWQSGVDAARGRCVVIMDGDLQNLPEDVYRLYRQLKYSNADIVQGWRSHIGRPRDFRYAMSRVLHYMLRALFGLRLHDIKSGFLICNREIFAHILRRRFFYYYFQTFIVISAYHKGYRIEEMESLFEERKLGKSFIASFPLKMILKNLVDVAKGFVEFRLLSRRTDVLGDFLKRHHVARTPEPMPLLRRAYLRIVAALMPLHHWKLSSSALRYFYQLRRLQWLTVEQIRELQELRLQALISHAYRHVPYYREMFDRLGIDPGEIRRLDDLQRLPVLSRDIIRRNLHFDLMSDAHDKREMLPIRTCGATGEPITLYAEKTQLEMRWATALRNQEWAGYRCGDRQLRPWEMDLGRPWLQALRARLDAILSRRAVVAAVGMDRDDLRRAGELVRRGAHALVEGNPAALNLIGATLSEPGRTGPRAVVSSQQTLSDELRASIEQRFAAKVFDRYGSREFSAIAHECDAHRGLHVNAESYIVEIVRDGRAAPPGEVGDVLITDLTNLCVPLIRYAIGDRATATDRQCPCGRGLPLIEAVQGRPAAVIIGANARYVPATFFSDALRDYGHAIRQFQVVQSEPGAVQLRIVRGPRFSDAVLQRLFDVIRAHLGAATAIDVQLVEHLAISDGGTHAPVISRLPISVAGLTAGAAIAAAVPSQPLPAEEASVARR